MNQTGQEATCDKKYKYEKEFLEDTVCFEDAEAFIRELETFHAKSGVHHIYRGQHCDFWTLLPAYLRLDTTIDLNQYRQMLLGYMKKGLHNGLDLPLDKPYESLIDPMRQRLLYLEGGPVDSPHRNNEVPSALVAHAQHHGLPTELLDATRDPLVASFFAAWNINNINDKPSGNSVVWILNENKLYKQTNLRVFTYPMSASFTPNQKSVFMWDSTWGHNKGSYEQPYEKELLKVTDRCGAFRRFVLSKEATVELRSILDKRGVTYTSMFPDWRDIACSIKKEHGFAKTNR